MVRVLLVLLLLSVVLSVRAGSLISSEYDHHFKRAAIYLPVGTDWRILKAQCYQESLLKPEAVSPVGAYGLCQFMPNTARELSYKYPELDNFWLPEISINAAAIYMNQLNKYWKSPRPDIDRYLLALASYNAGAGNLTKAQKRCDMNVLYAEIIKCLPLITGHHSKETIGYVKNIVGKWYVIILLD